MEVIKKREKIREKVMAEAREWAGKLPLKVTAILVGSYARGDFNLWSDIDIILISDGFKGNPIQRLKELDMLPAYQVIPLTPEEFKALLKKRDPLAIEAVRVGVILREDVKIADLLVPFKSSPNNRALTRE